jgi:hypothetical protein
MYCVANIFAIFFCLKNFDDTWTETKFQVNAPFPAKATAATGKKQFSIV